MKSNNNKGKDAHYEENTVEIDVDQVQAVLNELLKRGDYETVNRIKEELEYNEAKIKVILYELDQILDSLTEREMLLGGENDS